MIGVWVNLMGATTPELLQSALPRDAIGGGLTARIILVSERKKGKVVILPSFSQELADKLRDDLEQINMLSGEFKVTEEWLEKYTAWRMNAEENPPFDTDSRLGGYVERRATHLKKLCIVSSASRGDSKLIELCDLNRSYSWLADSEVRMPQAFSGIGKSKFADVLTHVWSYVGIKKDMTLAELQQKFFYDADKFELARILDTMISMKAIAIGNVGTETVIKYKGTKEMEAQHGISI